MGAIPNVDNVLDANGMNSLKRLAGAHDGSANRKVAQQFEGLFLSMMLKNMRAALPQDGPLSSDETRMATGMADDQLAQNLAKGKGIGLADALVKQMSRANATVAPGTGTQGIALHAQNQAALPFRSIEAAGLPYHGASRAISANVAPSAAAVTATHVDFVAKCGAAAKAASDATGIPTKAILGQAALESGWGKHEVKDASGQASFNLFGIKAGAEWTGKTVSAVTTEYVDGVAQKVVQKFRAYASYAESFADYAKTIVNNPRYAPVMQAAHDAVSFAKAMGHSGYATDPNYGQKLAQVITGPLSQLI